MNLRFSVPWLFAAVVMVSLASSTARSLLPDSSVWSVAIGGLSLGTLCFAAMAGISGRSAAATVFFSIGIYAWGLACLLLEQRFILGGETRMLLVVLGSVWMIWAWLPRDMELKA